MHLRIEGSKVRSFPPSEGFRPHHSGNRRRRQGFFSRWLATGTVAFVYVLRSEHGFIQLGSCADPLVTIAELRRKSPHRLYVDYLGFTRADLAEVVLQAAQAILDHQRVRAGWIDCAPDLAIAAVQSAALRLGYEIIPAKLDGVEHVLRNGSWVASIRIGLRRQRQGNNKALVAGLALGAMGILGAVVARKASGVDPGVLLGPTILIGLVMGLVALTRAGSNVGKS